MMWLLDSGPLRNLADKYDSSWAWPGGTLHVAEAVIRECRNRRNIDLLLDRMDIDGVHWIRRHDPGTSSATKDAFVQLRARGSQTAKNLGEDVSLALCIAELDQAVFVTEDAGAAYAGLMELGRDRVASSLELWTSLYRESLIDRDTAQRLCTSTCKKLGRPLPIRMKSLFSVEH